MDPLVVKVGGSLFKEIPTIVATLKESPRPLLIVPGGGPFAEAVRELGMSPDSAHWMAICAMEQMGWYIASHGIRPKRHLEYPRDIAVLLPYEELVRHDPLPHSWDVTSDTIAAWVAAMLSLDLLLLKSVDGISKGGRLLCEVREPVLCTEVDAAFMDFVFSHKIRATMVNGRYPDRIRMFLTGQPIPATDIHPSL